VILLIAAVLSPERINTLATAAFQRGMDVILELHDLDEIPFTAIPPNVILGLNNRNLKTFQVSIQNGIRQIDGLKALQCPIIAESGIHTPADAALLRDAGFSGMLIGESLIRSSNPSALLKAFSELPRR
jgi:indole-3-glycerol phosphate synthase